MHTFAPKPEATQQTTSAKSTIRGRGHFGQSPEVRSILDLQRTIGNQAVQRMLQTYAGQPAAELTETATCRSGHDFSRTPTHPPAAGAIQTKLAINKLGDSYEQEADHIAEQVTRTPEPQLQRACPCGEGCPRCRTEEPGQEHESFQTKRVQPSDTGQIAAPPIVHEVLASPGQPLDPATRAFMEPRFGHDFSHVRVHSGAAAEQSAREVNAYAYTVGHDIVFDTSRFAPSTREGRGLLAHELTHVVQQSGADGMNVCHRKANPKAQAKTELARKPKIVAITAGMGAKVGEATLDDGQLAPVTLSQNNYPPGTFVLNHKSNGKYARAQPVLDRDGKDLLPGFMWDNPALKGSKERTYDWHDTVTITITASASQRINLLAPHIRQALTGGNGKEATEQELEEVADAGELLEAAGVKAEELAAVEHQQWVRERTTGERGQEVGALQWAQGFVAERGDRKAQGEKGATDLISAAQLLAKEPLDLLGHGLLSQFVDSDDKKARLAMGLSYRQHKSIPLPDNMKPPQMEEWLINLVLPFRAQLLQFEKLLLADLRYNAAKALDAAEASLLLCNKRYAGVWGNNAPAPAYFWRRLQTINNSEAVIAARDWRTDQRAKINMETFLDRKSIESPYGLAPSVEDQLAFDKRETARDERREVVERTFAQDVRDKTGLPLLPGKNARTLLDAANAEEAIGVLRRYVIDGSDKIRMARDKIQSNRVLYGAEVWIKAENDRLKAALGAGAGTDIAILVDRFARMRRSETSFWQDLLHIIEFIANFVPGPIGWGLRLGTAVAGAHEAVTEHSSQNAIYGVGGSNVKPSAAPVALAGINVVASAIPDFGAVSKHVAGSSGIGRAERIVANETDDAARLSTHGGKGGQTQDIPNSSQASPVAGSELSDKSPVLSGLSPERKPELPHDAPKPPPAPHVETPPAPPTREPTPATTEPPIARPSVDVEPPVAPKPEPAPRMTAGAAGAGGEFVAAARVGDEALASGKSLPVLAPNAGASTLAKLPESGSARGQLFEGITDETKDLLKRRPYLRKVLEEHPNAADLFKLCESICFPDFVKPQDLALRLKRLETMQAEAAVNGVEFNSKLIKKLLHQQKDLGGIDEALNLLERDLKERVSGVYMPSHGVAYSPRYGDPRLEYGKGSPPINAGALGTVGFAQHAVEVVGQVPGRLASREARELRQALYRGDRTLADLVRELPPQGVAEVMFPTDLGRRFIDHVYFDGRACQVIFRESKNLTVFRLTKDALSQLEKDLWFLRNNFYSGLQIEWRISGQIDVEALRYLKSLEIQWGGRFRFRLDADPVP